MIFTELRKRVMLPISICTGCGACEAICPQNCIQLRLDKNGFRYPNVDLDKCVHCQKCEKFCPVLKIDNEIQRLESLPNAFACYIKDSCVRKESSSGGLFSALAMHVLDEKGVVFGAAYNKDLTVSHIAVEKPEELSLLRGSKYVQSDTSNCYNNVEQYLKSGRIVLFTGTPCQVEGLNSFLNKSYENLILVDIICHGVPSKKVWHEYLLWQEKKHGAKVVSANFRDKCSGWEDFSLTLKFDDGQIYSNISNDDYYMKLFLESYSLRDSCYQCKFKTINRVSDLTIGDFWGINEIVPEINDDAGISIVFVQSKKGKCIIESVKEQMILNQVDSRIAAEHNGAMIQSVYRQPMHNYFYKKLGKVNFGKLVNEVISPSVFTRLERKLLQFVNKKCNFN
jgi:coenzyme F420-reducing hydrogenase beta subunit